MYIRDITIKFIITIFSIITIFIITIENVDMILFYWCLSCYIESTKFSVLRDKQNKMYTKWLNSILGNVALSSLYNSLIQT